MDCLKCGFENPEQARFCAGCGQALAVIECLHCHTENAAGSRFCHSCGRPVTANSPKKELRSAHAERRILTVLFCDLVDSTVLVDNLDPEISRAIIRDFQSISKDEIEKLGGRVSTYLGDGIVALFVGHESNAERAINAALQINRKIDKAEASFILAKQKIRIRCGIATGLAIVGDDMLGHSQVRLETAIGLPMNLAARIQSLAQPGNTTIDHKTHEMTRGLFEFKNIGQHALKGIREEQQVWLVLAEKSISSRFVAHAAEVTPMVDRVEVLQQLVAHWDKSKHSNAQAVIFSGEAGIGKSRITRELADIISIENDYNHLEYQCSPHHTNTALHPVVNRIRAAAGFEHDDSTSEQMSRLELLVRGSSDDLRHDMPAFVDLLALPEDDAWPFPNLDPDEKKAWIFDTLINNMLSLSESTPLLITIEDIHWIDPTTLELLRRVADAIVGHPVMLLMTSRPGFDKGFLELPGVTTIEVERLEKKYAQQLVDHVRGDAGVPSELLDEIIERTDGIPLFIEELSKGLLESVSSGDGFFGAGAKGNIVLPDTLQESLLARLDHLPENSKSIAHLAAVIGRDFSFDLLEKVADYQDKNLYRSLTPLLQAQMVFQRKEPPNAEFSFRHALFRDAAYEAILKSDLINIHKRIGMVIAEDYPDVSQNNPELLARHFMEGGEYKKAAQYWLNAGKRASQKFALIEARTDLTEGLRCLDKCTKSEQEKLTRIEFMITLGPVLMALEGSGSEITRDHYANVVKQCAELPASAKQFSALWGQWLVSKDYQNDHGLFWANELQKLSEKLDDTELKLQSHHCHWTTYFHLGDFVNANTSIVEGLRLYDFDRHGKNANIFGGHDPKVCGDGFLAHVLWFMGNDNKALLQAEKCYVWATKIEHQASILHAIELNMLLQLFRRDQSRITKWYEKLKEICSELDLPEYEGRLKHCEGLVMTYSGSMEEGISIMNAGFDQLSQVGTAEDLSLYGETIAEAYLNSNRYEEGLKYIDEVIVIQESQRVQYWRSEVFRSKGNLLLELDKDKHALEYFELALDIANKQRAKALELRAAISLFLLNRKTGLYADGENRLKRILNDFKPGTSSPDQLQAQTLLNQIN